MPYGMAARMGDLTSHGSPLAPGPGSTNVLIGSMPAWRALMDFHACPIVKGLVPDVGGMVLMGSPTVLINSMMACRMLDMVVEIPGGPNPIALGATNVFIGDAGVSAPSVSAPAVPNVAVPQVPEVPALSAVEAAANESKTLDLSYAAPAIASNKEKEKEQEKAKPPKDSAAQRPVDEVYVIAVDVKTIGGTPLMNHPVRIIDPDTKEQIGEGKTNAEGTVRSIVPKNKNYRIEILEEKHETPDVPLHPGDDPAVLHCRFVDGAGSPIAHATVEGRSGDDRFALTTDEDGRLYEPAHLGHYGLKIGDHVFDAHSLPAKEAEDDDNLYLFIVPGDEKPDDDPGEELEDRPLRDVPDFDEEG